MSGNIKVIKANTPKEIQLGLLHKRNEDVEILQSLENLFKIKRGYVFKMPKSGTKVAACWSGGMDSIVNVGILMEEFGLEVYPFFINRGQSNYKYEKASAEFFNDWYAKKYPKLYHQHLEIAVNTPASEYKDQLRKRKKQYDDIPLMHDISYPMRNSIIFLTGAEYAYAMGIKTLFAAHVKSDTSFHCSLTWHRALNLEISLITHEWDFQFTSIPIESHLGNHYDKETHILYGIKLGLPLEKTHSCVKNNSVQCGDCPACWDRRRTFKELGKKDLTEYRYEMSVAMPSYYDLNRQ